jgi:serine O-acetyltransferase
MASNQPSGLKGDIARLFSATGTHSGRPSLLSALERVVTRPGPLAIALYRASHALWARGLHTAAEIVWRLNLFLSGADIHPGAEIGGGLRVVHTSGLVVGKGVVIGSNVTLLHGVTLGGSARGFIGDASPDGFPVIEDGCKISAGAKVLGPVTIGEGAFIGANAVVAKDVAPGSVFTPGRETSDLRRRVQELERQVAELKAALPAEQRD